MSLLWVAIFVIALVLACFMVYRVIKEMIKTAYIKFKSFLPKNENKADDNEPSLWEYSLFTDLLFFGAITIFLATLIISGILAYQTLGSSPQYEVQISIGGIKNLLSYFSPVIQLCTGLLAILGIIALIFRSEQTAKQINHGNRLWEHEKRNSSYSNYLDHNERYQKLLGRIEQDQRVAFTDKTELYKACFPNSCISNFKILLENEGKGESSLLKAMKILRSLSDAETSFINAGQVSIEEIENQINKIKELYQLLNISAIRSYEKYGLAGVNLNMIQDTFAITVNGLLGLSASEERVSENTNGIGSLYGRIENLKASDQLRGRSQALNYIFSDPNNANTVELGKRVTKQSTSEVVT
ncbi:hypothetical protein Misp06_03624 [Microbulbifer sp. NBRC 101763]|uniref:hypothetical protein n=1 Tax=Microbulbifer sp. NBRC 101763 TaxID=1113820 RepID=UPI0030A17000